MQHLSRPSGLQMKNKADVMVLCCWKLQLGLAARSHCFQLSLFPLQLALLYCRVLQLVVRVYICFCICWSVVDNPLPTVVPFYGSFHFWRCNFIVWRLLLKVLRSMISIFACKYVLWADPAQVYNLTLDSFCFVMPNRTFQQIVK
jgi:hypothetical protein